MKLNNKGITLVEIIVSIALISLVLIFLFSLLIKLNGVNKKNEVNSTYLITKALIIKNIEEDIKDSTNFSVGTCNIQNFFDRYTSYQNGLTNSQKANLCLKFTFKDIKNIQNESFLGIYYYKRTSGSNDDSYVISYINESKNIIATRNLPNFEDYNVTDSNYKYNYTIKTNGGVTLITIPILGPDGHDYTITIPYSSN